MECKNFIKRDLKEERTFWEGKKVEAFDSEG